LAIDCSNSATVTDLYVRMGPYALRKALTIVRRRDIAEEIVQEVFTKMVVKGGTFPNELAVYKWIYVAAHNACIDYLRSSGYKREKLAETSEVGEAAAPISIDRVEALDLIRKVADKLPARDLAIFIWSTRLRANRAGRSRNRSKNHTSARGLIEF
jgi:DNA-directed RNA polymerase specialized sigma subunit, sigma24 homolog